MDREAVHFLITSINKVVVDVAVPSFDEFNVYVPVTLIVTVNNKIPYWFIWSSPVDGFKVICDYEVVN